MIPFPGIQGCRVKKWPLFSAPTTPWLSFSLIFVLAKLNLANSSGLNTRKYTPLSYSPKVALTAYKLTCYYLSYTYLAYESDTPSSEPFRTDIIDIYPIYSDATTVNVIKPLQK